MKCGLRLRSLRLGGEDFVTNRSCCGELPRDGVYFEVFTKLCGVAEFLSPLKWSDLPGGLEFGERAFRVWFGFGSYQELITWM